MTYSECGAPAQGVVFCLFASEVLIKCVAKGFWHKPPGKLVHRPYFRRGANRLDFTIVVLIGLSYIVGFFSPGERRRRVWSPATCIAWLVKFGRLHSEFCRHFEQALRYIW